MKVKATKEYQKRKIKAVELDRIPKEGEEFDIADEKFKILSGKNKYKAKFVEKVDPLADKENDNNTDPLADTSLENNEKNK